MQPHLNSDRIIQIFKNVYPTTGSALLWADALPFNLLIIKLVSTQLVHPGSPSNENRDRPTRDEKFALSLHKFEKFNYEYSSDI